MIHSLEGKVILVTGAGKGSGRRAAEALARQGARLAACDISPVNLDETVAHIRAAGGQVQAYVEDISKKMLVQGLLHQVIEDFGRIDVLVNCAEVEPQRTVLEMDDWDWQRTLDVNLSGAFLLVQSLGRSMKEKGSGMIFLLGDRAHASTSRAAYAASKAGLTGLAQAAASELAPHGVQVRLVETVEQVLEELGA
jgi:NAD(P)-dependent dehydrogenase (short-subunit alcohol dehydrogenase family)